MPGVSRLGDVCTGHGCFPSRPSTGSVLAAGSPNVFVNGMEIARIGDPVACGSAVATGSGNVFANE